MKKSSSLKKPLRLTTETIRTLTGTQLDLVAGGAISASRNAASCGGTKQACDTGAPAQ